MQALEDHENPFVVLRINADSPILNPKIGHPSENFPVDRDFGRFALLMVKNGVADQVTEDSHQIRQIAKTLGRSGTTTIFG